MRKLLLRLLINILNGEQIEILGDMYPGDFIVVTEITITKNN